MDAYLVKKRKNDEPEEEVSKANSYRSRSSSNPAVQILGVEAIRPDEPYWDNALKFKPDQEVYLKSAIDSGSQHCVLPFVFPASD